MAQAAVSSGAAATVRTLVPAVALALVAACSPGSMAPSVLGPGGTAPVATGGATSARTSAPTGIGGLSGTWAGALTDANGSYPLLVTLDGCTTTGAACGELEYLDAAQGGTVMCASELTLRERDGERFAFTERYVYRGWMCLTTTYAMTRGADGSIEVRQVVDSGEVCCRGILTRVPGDRPSAAPATAIAGLGRASAGRLLGGATTQYAAAGAGSLWFPLDDLGAVARVAAATGAVTARIETGDPGSLAGLKSDPHAVVAGAAGVWVAQAAHRAVGRIDPATDTIVDTIAVPGIPYGLALDGKALWVTSFEDDLVVRVDLATGKVVAQTSVSKPTGIAVGLGGVWVVRHRDDSVVRLDSASGRVVAEISLGAPGPSTVCGMCVENVVVAGGSVWTANNEGRSVSRIDPATNRVVATIALPLRAWAVTAGDGAVWASQFETNPDGSFANPSGWGVARIDAITGAVQSFAVPGTLSVFWADDALWLASPGRRGDVLTRVELLRE